MLLRRGERRTGRERDLPAAVARRSVLGPAVGRAHPGRWAATIGTEYAGPDDPLAAAGARVMNLIAAVLRGYGLGEDEMSHAIRVIRSTVHGFAALEAARGFQWDAEPDQSFEWMIGFLDRGLRPAV